ncbi:MAG: 2Fe-2S iron-sulfur cluster-binding protein [Sphaerochaetaceae bacterium]|jgi:carbon-monoxide dehydrogenase small subunit
MKIECTIDGKHLSLSVNSNKPLSLILMEEAGNQSLNSRCRGNNCGNCIVLLNGEAVLSCMIPAFRLRGADIKTFDSFQKTRACHDIERAYAATGSKPCPNCYAAKTLIIESILQGLERPDDSQPFPLPARGRVQNLTEELDPENIIQELELNRCRCMDSAELLQIVNIAAGYRRRRRVRRN